MISNSDKPLRVASLYSGAGGLDLGFIDEGFDIFYANEIEKWACDTYDAEMKRRGLSHRIDRSDIDDADLPEEGSADVVIGGPPCQAYSVAGKMDPEDDRSRHVFVFLETVARIRPQVFIMENVLNLARNARFAPVRQALEEKAREMGYATQLLTLDADKFGVPQKRQRMFFVGRLGDNPAEPEQVPGHPTVRKALANIPKYGEEGNNTFCNAKITPAKNPVLRVSPYAGMLFNGAGRPLNLDAPALTLPASMGGNRTPIIDQESLNDASIEPWIVQYHDHLVNGGNVTEEIPTRLRRLTVEEAATLQSFPQGMKFAGPSTAQFKQIGNAVPVGLARAVAKSVKKMIA